MQGSLDGQTQAHLYNPILAQNLMCSYAPIPRHPTAEVPYPNSPIWHAPWPIICRQIFIGKSSGTAGPSDHAALAQHSKLLGRVNAGSCVQAICRPKF